MFLHNNVVTETFLVDSFLDDCVVKHVTQDSTVEHLTSDVSLTDVSNVAFVWHYPGYCRLPFFHDEKSFGVSGEEPNIPERPTYHYFSKHIVDFMKSLPDGCKVDLLSCNLNTSHFMEEVQRLEDECSVDIRYSLDQTGNNPDGNWVLESDGVDIKDVYFKESIATWSGILNSGKTPAEIASNNTYDFSYNQTTNTMTLLRNIVWTDLSGVNTTDFIQLSKDDTFDGSGHTINLSGITDCQGLFACDEAGADVNNRAKIMNLGVLNGATAGNGGFIVRASQRFFEVESCYSTGNIGIYGGGICGSYTAENGTCTVTNCYSTGSIGEYGGGICGIYAGYRYHGTCTVTNCYSTGSIGNNGGGICGKYAGYSGTCTITNCYSTGSIGEYGGGICGTCGYSGTCTITNCYSTGSIGNNGGGICGSAAGYNGTCTVTNCYSTGNIGTYGGGICSTHAGRFNGTCTVTNCYSTGSIGVEGGGICGKYAGYSGTCTVRNCYSTGNIGELGGGICGNGAGINSGTCTVTHCYSQRKNGNIINGNSDGTVPMDGNYNVSFLSGGKLDANLNVDATGNDTGAFEADIYGTKNEYPLLKSFRTNTYWDGKVFIMENGNIIQIYYDNYDLTDYIIVPAPSPVSEKKVFFRRRTHYVRRKQQPQYNKNEKVVYLEQKHFTNGTVILDKYYYIVTNPKSFKTEKINTNIEEGYTLVYKLKENISFNPNISHSIDLIDKGTVQPEQYVSQGGYYHDMAFGIGFFAAIVLIGSDYTLDLNNCTLEQSFEHSVRQRFFSLIQLGNSPFLPKTGPHDFINSLQIASNVNIRNGILGRSSHHGIHGNNNTNISIEDLTFKDFEVAAVALNGGSHNIIRNVNVKKTNDNVAVLGIWSALLFLHPYIKQLSYSHPLFELNIQGNKKTAKELYKTYKYEVEKALNELNERKFTKNPLFNNAKRIPDGPNYGILLNRSNVAVNGFPKVIERESNHTNTITNVDIRNIRGFNNEIPTLSRTVKQDNTNTYLSHNIQTDVVGAVFQTQNYYLDKDGNKVPLTIDGSGVYVGNIVSDIQLIISKAIHSGITFGSLSTKVNTIEKETIEWAENGGQIRDTSFYYIFQGDTMHHVIKGVTGLRLDCMCFSKLKNVNIQNITNESMHNRLLYDDLIGVDESDIQSSDNSVIYNAYKNNEEPSHSKATYAVHQGEMVRGISLCNAYSNDLENITIRYIRSFVPPSNHPNVFCIDYHNTIRMVEKNTIEKNVICIP
mgnify:CR=1 FL=1